MNIRFIIPTSIVAICFAGIASAQQPAGPLPPQPSPAPTGGQPGQVQYSTPPPAPGQPGAPPPAGDEEHEKGRFRWGISAIGGYFGGAGYGAGGGGVEVRLGYQINRTMGVFAEPAAFIAAGSNTTTTAGGVATSTSSSAVAMVPFPVLFGYAPVDIFEIGVGPALVAVAGGSASSGTGGSSAGGIAGSYFGAMVRPQLVLGGRNEMTGRRKGFAISAEFLPIFVSGGPVYEFNIGLGYESF